MAGSAEREDEERGKILSVHLGESANCSSVGSVVDILFVSAVAGSALVAAVMVLLDRAAEKKKDEREGPR